MSKGEPAAEGKVCALPPLLLAVYWVGCVYYSFNPVNYSTWLLENATVWVCLAPVIYLYCKGYRLSGVSYAVIFIAASLQTIGGHYGFAHVPCGEWMKEVFGLYRTSYDRVGHFVCGLLALPILDALSLRVRAPRVLLCACAVMSIMGVAALYEIFEWFVVSVVDNMTAEEYIGWQGDPWDAQADMLMCLLGTLTSVFISCFIMRSAVFDAGRDGA